MQDYEDQSEDKVFRHANRASKYPHVSKVGSFKQSEIKTIQSIVHQIQNHYPDNIESQADLIVKSLQQQFGKHFQAFIFQLLADEGHSLGSTNGRHIIIEYKRFTYIIWHALLDETFQ